MILTDNDQNEGERNTLFKSMQNDGKSIPY